MAMIVSSITKQIEKIICQNITVLFEKKASDLIQTIGDTLKNKLDEDTEFMKSIAARIEATLSEKLQEFYDQAANQVSLSNMIEPIIMKSLAMSLEPMLQDAINKTLTKFDRSTAGVKRGGGGSGRKSMRSRRVHRRKTMKTK
jgi:hypothetical protein